MSMTKGADMRPLFRTGLTAIMALGLASCVSLGGAEPPPSLLRL